MLEQAGLSRFKQNMVLTYTKGQRTMIAIAEALLEQHYDVRHRKRETPTPTGNSSSPNRWRRRDTSRAYLAEAEPIKELIDTAAYGEESISDDYDGEQDETEDDEIHETDFAALLGNSGEDPETDDALAEALQLDAVAMVAWQRFNGKGKGKSKGKGKVKGKGKGKYKGNNLSLEERKKRLAELKSRTNCQACGARGHLAGDDICPKNAKNESTLQSPARAYLTIGGETSGFDLALTGDEMSFDATALVAHARLDASDIPVETPPKAPPGTRRPRKPPPPPPTPQCVGGCKEYSRRGTNATVERFTCVDCGFVTTWSLGATEDPAMCPHVETDSRGSSKTLVRHTCKACLKVILELPRNEATVRESTAKDVSRADTSQFRDISLAMHVRPQTTLNAREVDLVLGLLTRDAHVHLSRFSSISGTDFVSLLDDAIESILDPTCQRVNQEQRCNQKPLLRIARTTRSSRMFSYRRRHSCWQYKRLSWLWMRMETRLANGVINRWTHLLTLVKGNRIHLLSLCKSSRSRLLTLCEGSRRCLVFLRSKYCKDSSSQVTAFARRAELRASARRAFIREDCGRRVARVVLRKAAPLVGEYATGDIVCYRKEDQRCSPACRLIVFDGNKTAWLICAGTPVCAAVDRSRPATSAEAHRQ